MSTARGGGAGLRALVVSMVALLIASAAWPAASAAEGEPPTRLLRVVLRADWSNPTDAPWSGALRISAGRVVSARALALGNGLCRVLPGTDAAAVRFTSPGLSARCGLEVVVEAPPQAQVELAIDDHRLETRLSELLQGTVSSMGWTGSARLRRDPDDMLRLTVDRPHLVFAPGEETNIDLEFNLLSDRPRSVPTRLGVELRHTRAAESLAEHESVTLPTNADTPLRRRIRVRMPEDEGPYELLVRAEPAGFKPVVRSLAFVVIRPVATPADPAADPAGQLVQEIDPSAATPAARWYSTRRLLSRTGRIGQFLWSSIRHPFGGPDRVVELPANVYRLNVPHPGTPHLLSIEYTDDAATLVAASIRDMDLAGRLAGAPLTTGVRSAEGFGASGSVTNQVVFWPQTSNPAVEVYVEGASAGAVLKKVRLYEFPRGLPPLEIAEPAGPRRLFGVCVDDPSAGQALGGSRVADPKTGLPLADWRTFWESADHLVAYARYAGYNCVAATVVGHGGAAYPTALLPPSSVLGAPSDLASGPCPDLVELLMRLCDRGGLDAMPALRFDGTIPALEAQRDAGELQESGILLVSRDGTCWRDRPARGGMPCRYNPLHPAVQSAMLDVVREFVARYADHASFRTLALDLASDSHLTLPGVEWGYDDHTVADFVHETGAKLPVAAEGESRFDERYRWLTGAGREQWTAWRCRQLATFYERVLAELRRPARDEDGSGDGAGTAPQRRLVLAATTLLGPGAADLRDVLRQGRTIEDLLRTRGLDLRGWSVPDGIVVLRPFAASGTTPESLHLNSNRELDELMAKLPGRGALCYHEPELLDLAGPHGPGHEKTSDTVPVVLEYSGRSALRRFARALAVADCQLLLDGGPVLPAGQEEAKREFARVFRSLPAGGFQSVEVAQPLVVRSARDAGDTLIYLVNDAGYAVETQLTLNCPPETTVRNGATGDTLTVEPAPRGLFVRMSLEPFQVVPLLFPRPDAAVAACDVALPSQAEQGMRARFDRLTQAMAILGRDAPRTLPGLPPNGDFEEPADFGALPAGWNCEGEGCSCGLDVQTVHGGKASLRLSGEASSAAVSDPFVALSGRTVALNVWLRAAQPGMRIRWSLSAKRGDVELYRHADMALKQAWEPVQFRARDLPEGELQAVRIRFELLDSGTLWIDEAHISVLPISSDEQRAIRKAVYAALSAWKARRYSDFERLADSYWPTYLIESVEGAADATPATPADDSSDSDM